tara:strand:+ start:215 stop:463 length:249 start_codon:yes stop_codon:yes gene_type:complete
VADTSRASGFASVLSSGALFISYSGSATFILFEPMSFSSSGYGLISSASWFEIWSIDLFLDYYFSVISTYGKVSATSTALAS